MSRLFVVLAALLAWAMVLSSPSHAFQLAISQYGRVTATLPWAVAMEKGYFDDAGIKIDEVIAGAGGGTTLRNVLASDLPYGEVATSAAIAASRSGLDIVIVNTSSSHIGEISLVADAKSDIRKMADLAGKKAAYTAPKSTSDVLLRLALKETQMTGKVETVATGGFGPGITALTTGAIAAAPMIDPTLTLEPRKVSGHPAIRRRHSAHDLAGRHHDAGFREEETGVASQTDRHAPSRRRLHLSEPRRRDANLRQSLATGSQAGRDLFPKVLWL